MKKIYITFLFACLLIFSNSLLQAQKYQYIFTSSLNELSGGPALTETLSCGALAGSFTTGQTITTTDGTCSVSNRPAAIDGTNAGTSTVFSFNEGGGLNFANNPSFITSSYTIQVFFKFSSYATGYARIIDFSNSTADAGIYTLNSCLNFYPNGNVGTCPGFIDGNYYLITLVRDGSTGTIKIYVNGTVFSTYSDAGNTYIPATSTTPIIFFRDDNAVTCEDEPGLVKYISISPLVSTDTQVADVFANICSVVSLPVTLVSFDVTKINSSSVSVKWKTSQELGITGYVIERSTDGINFKPIGQVSVLANNSSIQDYQFTDEAPVKGTSYYRIKILDKDQSKKYSAIRNIKISGPMALTIFPVPVKNMLTINIDAETAAKGKMMIADISGRQLHNSAISVTQGSNTITFNTSHLSAGSYVLKIILDKTSIIKKFTKL